MTEMGEKWKGGRISKMKMRRGGGGGGGDTWTDDEHKVKRNQFSFNKKLPFSLLQFFLIEDGDEEWE